LMAVRDNLEKTGFEIENASITYIAKNPVDIDTVEKARKVLKLLEALEDDDDVSNVYSNFDISEDIMNQL